VTVRRGLAIERLAQFQVADDRAGAQVKVIVLELKMCRQFFVSLRNLLLIFSSWYQQIYKEFMSSYSGEQSVGLCHTRDGSMQIGRFIRWKIHQFE
jgi:hypothetical protein